MIKIGNFLFRYRNLLFILLYILLFVPSPDLFSPTVFGDGYYCWPIISGLCVTILGQLIRGATIGLVYIIRGGRDRRIFAEGLVTAGMFNHCRNPLYVGNILMLLGIGVLANSLIYVLIVMPLFMFIYQAIVLAEENFLRNKFGEDFTAYCRRVNRWIPSVKGLSATFSSMKFNWKRWLLKEYNTQYIWMTGIVLILLFKYPHFTSYSNDKRNLLLLNILPALGVFYVSIRYLKKSGKWKGQ